jgi:hypothetical protein
MSMMTAKKSQGVAAAANPPAFRAASTFPGASADPWTPIPKPAGVVDGDILVMVLGIVSNIALTSAGAGWVPVTNSPTASPGADCWVHVLTKVAASEPADYSVDWASAIGGAACILAYSGGNAVTPVDGAAGAGFASTATPTGPTVTPSLDHCVVLAIYGCDEAASVTWTPPTGYDERVDTLGAFSMTLHVAELTQTTKAAASPQATVSIADEGVAFTVALRPA